MALLEVLETSPTFAVIVALLFGMFSQRCHSPSAKNDGKSVAQ
jgi:hypothetical protein